MKISILHLTDLHFTETTNLLNRLNFLFSAVNDFAFNSEKLYIVITGDIANTGKSTEYDVARHFLKSMITLMNKEKWRDNHKFVIVPGNHDCNFTNASQIRHNSIENMSYATLGNDDSVINACLDVQKEFWNFYAGFNSVPKDKLLYQITDKVNDKRICFHCLNSSWISRKDEIPGSVFHPIKKYAAYDLNESHDINIGVCHHPLNWFNPNTSENNKVEVENFFEKISTLNFFGHEHIESIINKQSLILNTEGKVLSGKLFNDNKTNQSGFQCLTIDLETNESITKIWNWTSDHYLSNEKEIRFNLSEGYNRTFTTDQEFYKELNEVKIPLIIGERKDIKLSEIYIFPDVESVSVSKDEDILEDYFDSEKLLNDNYKYCILEGENQVGKSSLLSIIYQRFLNKGYYPILIKGNEFKDSDLMKVVKRSFNQQYVNGDFDKYIQLDKSYKVLLIDDFHGASFNSKINQLIIEEGIAKFCHVYVTVSSAYPILTALQTNIKEVKLFVIKPLGYKKRHDLIEKYYSLKVNPHKVTETDILQQVKYSFDEVQSILGEKLMPSNPIYILSILQALDYKPLSLKETSYAYCYQALIFYSLHKANIENENIDTYINFLTELAYEYVVREENSLTTTELEVFYDTYKANYITPSYEKLIINLKKSKILLFEDENVFFGYPYILYYLSAKKISDIINKKEGKEMISKLFSSVHLERNANILVFITHHTKDIEFIEHSMLNSMIVLETVQPITLCKNDAYYLAIKDLIVQISDDILDMNRNPREERSKQLEVQDQRERLIEKDNQDENEFHESILPFHQSYRCIEIVGQIIRNRKGSLEIPKLTEMVSEMYLTGFRTISYMSDMLRGAKDDIIDTLNTKVKEDTNRRKLEEKVSIMFQLINFQLCLGVFVKVMHSIGNKEMRKIFEEVANKINTPAAKLVSFSINSYYNTLSIEDLKSLAKEFEGNVVATQILKARAKAYVYNRNPEYKVKQRIAEALKMNIKQYNKVKPQAQLK